MRYYLQTPSICVAPSYVVAHIYDGDGYFVAVCPNEKIGCAGDIVAPDSDGMAAFFDSINYSKMLNVLKHEDIHFNFVGDYFPIDSEEVEITCGKVIRKLNKIIETRPLRKLLFYNQHTRKWKALDGNNSSNQW